MSVTLENDDVQVLEFQLGSDTYCIDIDYVAEIVDGGTMTTVPNSPPHVMGVMDLRGRTTTIINPLEILETEETNPEELLTDGGRKQNRIMVLDSETTDSENATGWLVSDVDEVSRVSESDIEGEAVADSPVLRGFIQKDDEFIIWIDPEEMLA